MIAPWQEFTGNDVCDAALRIDEHYKSSALNFCHSGTEPASKFLQLFDDIGQFKPSDVKLLGSAKHLNRVFTLPNDHSRGLYFVGAQGNNFNANGADDTPVGAIRSCLGEALERRIHQNRTIASEKTVDAKLYPHSKPHGDDAQWFADLQGCNIDRYDQPLLWVAAKSLASDECLLIPVDYAFRLQESNEISYQSETNGMATGPDTDSAITSALLELIERDTLALWWYGECSAYQLNVEPKSNFDLLSFICLSRRNSARPMWLVSIENIFKIPVIAALSADINGERIIAGFGANPDVQTACRSAICELGQMELGLHLVELKLEQGGPASLNDNDCHQLDRAKRLKLSAYPELFPSVSTTITASQSIYRAESRLRSLVNQINKAGFRPYVLDMTDRNIGIPCYRAIIPGLECCSIKKASTRLKQHIESSGNTVVMLLQKPSPI